MFFVSNGLLAQNKYSTNNKNNSNKYLEANFADPINLPFILSGSFGELRSNHFHSGLDIKTNNQTGIRVNSIDNGYVSRIKIMLWSYGKVLYITHPNGYTSVYAHLKNFSPKIEAYVKKQQYKNESYEIKLFPKKGKLNVKKGELIALSGNSGGTTGPHLHFEIRQTKSEEPINPMLFGYNIADHKKPIIGAVIAYPLNDTSQVNQSNLPVKVHYKILKNGNYIADKISAYGQIGIGLNIYDRQDSAKNKNGVYELKLRVNGTLKYHYKLDKFSFKNTKFINLFLDYKEYYLNHQTIQKCFIEPQNKLGIYDKTLGSGIIKILNDLNYSINITSEDFKQNKTQIIIPVQGEKDSILVKRQIIKTPYFIKNNLFNKYSIQNVNIAFPKHTFYNNFYLKFNIKNDTAFIGKNIRPLNKKFTLTFYLDSLYGGKKSHLYIARIIKNKYANYENTIYKENKIYTTLSKLGTYALLKDSILPTIKPLNFENKQWISNLKFLKVKINDANSGIYKYDAFIDGKWILMEYNPKNGILAYNFRDKIYTKAKHLFKLIVTDNANNTNVYTATFFRKK